MNDLQVCRGNKRCTSPSVIACSCGELVTFLCESCIVPHLQEPHPHLFLQLDQAKQLITQTEFSVNLMDVTDSYSKIQGDFKSYIRKLKSFKAKLYSFKHQIFRQIECSLKSSMHKVDCLLGHAYIKLNELNRSTGLTKRDHEILETYEARGIRGLIDSYAETLTLRDKSIKRAVNRMIKIDLYSDIKKSETNFSPLQKLSELIKQTEVNNKLIMQIDNLNKDQVSAPHHYLPNFQEVVQGFDWLAHSLHPDSLELNKPGVSNHEQVSTPHQYVPNFQEVVQEFDWFAHSIHSDSLEFNKPGVSNQDQDSTPDQYLPNFQEVLQEYDLLTHSIHPDFLEFNKPGVNQEVCQLSVSLFATEVSHLDRIQNEINIRDSYSQAYKKHKY